MKKNIKLFLALLTAAVLLASLSAGAMAEWTDGVIYSEDLSSISGQQDRTVFIAGQNVKSDADVKGLILSAGYDVNIDGKGEYIMAAANNTAITGEASRDAFAAGNYTTLSGKVERDAYIVGNNVTITGEVGRNLYAAGSSVTINGKIGGDVYIDADKISLGSDVIIEGTLRYNSSANVTTVDNSNISGTEIYESATPQGEERTESTGNKVWDKVRSYLGQVALAFVLLWLTTLWENVDTRYTGKPFGKYASAFGIGFGVLAGLPIAAIILMVTGIGLRLAFVLLLLYAAVLLASPVFLGFFLGSLIWRGLIKKAPCYWAELPIGLLVWWVACQLPVLNFVVNLVSAPLGLGVMTLLLGKKKTAAAVEPQLSALPENSADAEDK